MLATSGYDILASRHTSLDPSQTVCMPTLDIISNFTILECFRRTLGNVGYYVALTDGY